MISLIILKNFHKKMKIIFLFYLLFSCNISAQVSDIIDYYPLKVGNEFYYYKASHCPAPYTYIYSFVCLTRRILDSVIINNQKYYVAYVRVRGLPDSVRVDSNGNIIILRQTKEQIFYKLNANTGDSWNFIDTIGGREYNYKVTLKSKTDTVSVHAGKFTNCFRFFFDAPNSRDEEFTDWLAPNIGQIARCIQEPFELGKAIIDGKEYPLTSVPEEKNPISSFKLYQNYPNPFKIVSNMNNEDI